RTNSMKQAESRASRRRMPSASGRPAKGSAKNSCQSLAPGWRAMVWQSLPQSSARKGSVAAQRAFGEIWRNACPHPQRAARRTSAPASDVACKLASFRNFNVCPPGGLGGTTPLSSSQTFAIERSLRTHHMAPLVRRSSDAADLSARFTSWLGGRWRKAEQGRTEEGPFPWQPRGASPMVRARRGIAGWQRDGGIPGDVESGSGGGSSSRRSGRLYDLLHVRLSLRHQGQ